MKLFDLWLADILFRWAYKLLAKNQPPIVITKLSDWPIKPQQQERTLH